MDIAKRQNEAAEAASLANYWAHGSARLCGIFWREVVGDIGRIFYAGFVGKKAEKIIRRKCLEKYSPYFSGIIPMHFLRKMRKKPDYRKIKFDCVFVILFEVQIN